MASEPNPATPVFDTSDGLADRASVAAELPAAYPTALSWGADTVGVFPIVEVAFPEGASTGDLTLLSDDEWVVDSFGKAGWETLISFPDDVDDDEARRRIAATDDDNPVPVDAELGKLIAVVRTVAAHIVDDGTDTWTREVRPSELHVVFDLAEDQELLTRLVRCGRFEVTTADAERYTMRVNVDGENLYDLLRAYDAWDPKLLGEKVSLGVSSPL